MKKIFLITTVALVLIAGFIVWQRQPNKPLLNKIKGVTIEQQSPAPSIEELDQQLDQELNEIEKLLNEADPEDFNFNIEEL